MRVRLPGFDRVDLAKLFTEHIEKQQQVQRIAPQLGQQARLTFKFTDAFETSHNGAQQWLVRREVGEPMSATPSKSVQKSERATRSLFSQSSFEPARVAPVDLGQTRSTVNRFHNSAGQDNGFRASVSDF